MTVPAVYQFDFATSLPPLPPFAGAVAIYVLCDPAAPSVVRYVGKTTNPRLRFNNHCFDGLHIQGRYCARWVGALRRQGRRPILRVISWVSEDEWPAAECAAIAQANQLFGKKMTNDTPGGLGGVTGRALSAAHRAAISAALKGRKHSPEHTEAVRLAQLGKTISAQARAKNSAAHKGKPYTAAQRAAHAAKNYVPSQQTRAAISAARKGHPVSAETRERIAATKRGKPRSAETRAKVSASLKERARRLRERAAPTSQGLVQLPLPLMP